MENVTTTVTSPIKVSTMITYSEITNVLSIVDYVIFVGMLLISVVIGVYFGFFGPKHDKEVYLLGGRNMNVLPVSISLIASSVSGIAILAVPADVYRYGANTWWLVVAIFIACLITGFIFLPILFNLSTTSVYEYFNIRFDKKVRTLASFLYTVSLLLYNPIVIYIPALVFAQVTGFNVYIITIISCSLCIIYTTMGGLKAVIWTDVFQFLGIMISVVGVFVLGIIATGGFQNVWQASVDSNRLTLDFSWDPTMRDSIWSILIGASVTYITQLGVNQAHMQKFLSLSTLKQAKQAVAIYCLGYFIILSSCVFTGNIMYARYKDCDPLTAKLIEKPDQIVPYFVMDVAGNIPTIPGFFLAGIFSASLSTLSATINTISSTVYEDFILLCIQPEKIKKHSTIILKAIVIFAGLISTGLVYIVANMGGIFPIFVALQGITNGPLVGLFLLGVFVPFANASGALIGGISGLAFIVWISGGHLYYKSKHIIYDIPKPISVEGCNIFINETIQSSLHDDDKPFILYRLSIWYNTVLCVFVVLLIGTIASCVTRKKNFYVKPELISCVVRYFIPQTLKLKNNKNSSS